MPDTPTTPSTLTTTWLRQQGACAEMIRWYQQHPVHDAPTIIRAMVAANHWNWANWLIVRVMTYAQYIAYAIFAAEQVLRIYRRDYPDDPRPRQAIDVAQQCLEQRMRAARTPKADVAALTGWATAHADESAKAARAAAESAWTSGAAWAARAAAWASEAARMAKVVGEAGGVDLGARAAAMAAVAAVKAAKAAKANNKETWDESLSARVKAEAAMQQDIITYGLTLLESSHG